MSLPFSSIFPSGVDPLPNLGAAYQNSGGFDAPDRLAIATQIQGLQKYANSVAVFTITGSTVITSISTKVVVLSGAPSTGFTITLPTTLGTPFYIAVYNNTAQAATLVPSSGGSSSLAIPNNTGIWVLFDGNNLDEIAGGSSSGGGGSGPTGYPTLPTTAGYWALSSSSGGPPYSWVPLTSDIVGSGFNPTLTLASGGSGPFEIGATWTPTVNASPATNSGSLSSSTIQDNLGNSSSVSAANPLNAPISGHTYTISTASTVSISVTENQTSPAETRTTNSVSASFEIRFFGGVGTAGATSITYSGGNATLTGATGTLTGALVATAIGYTFPVQSPSGQKVYVVTPHTATPHTFVDALTTFAFVFNSPTTISFTNQLGVTGISMDIYESTSLLSGNFQPKITG